MATSTPLNINTAEQGLCLSFNEIIKELPEFLQPGDEQEQRELAMFLSQVNDLHKPIVGQLSARYVFDFLKQMIEPSTPAIEGPSEVIIPGQLQEVTDNIAFEVARNIICDFDLHNTIVEMLNIMQEVSWESKAALLVTTFVLTFGDSGLSLCEKSKVSVSEIQMFANLQDGYKHQWDDSENLFTSLYQLIGSISEFEVLPMTYMISKDPKVKAARTHLLVAIYWIMRIIVIASASHIMKLSNGGNEYDKVMLSMWKLFPLWCKKLKDLCDKGHLKDKLSQLQNLLKEVVDIEAYNKIKDIVEQGNHADNMEVLNVVFSSATGDMFLLYDCLRERKVHLDELKGAYVLLFISGLENIAPEVDETKLKEFINNFDPESNENEVECNIVWMPIVDEDRLLQRKEATQKNMVKPFLRWLYVVEKLNSVMFKIHGFNQRNFKGWYSIDESSRISNEVKKLVKDDWKYKKGDPIIVVLDPQGNVVNHNAIHLFYSWGTMAFPFTSKRELDLWKRGRIYAFGPLEHGMGQLYDTMAKSGKCYFYYGGASMEWIRSFTRMMREVTSELGIPANMIYVGRSHNQEHVRSVIEENLSYCLTDQYYLWLLWKNIEGMIISLAHTRNFDERMVQDLQTLLNYDKSNVGWVVISPLGTNYGGTFHGRLVLSTLKEFKQWKEKALNEGLYRGFKSHYKELERKIFPFKCIEFPAAAAPKDSITTMVCPECDSEMQHYTTFVCYHPQPSRGK